MIPKLNKRTHTEKLYIDFLNMLDKRGFSGEIQMDHGNRTVLSTDNSIYQILPQAVVYPRCSEDIVRLTRLASEQLFNTIVMSPRGGGTGTNGQSLTDGIIVDVSKYMTKILEINQEECWVKVQAGVVKDQLNAALKPHGLFFAPELSTSNRATIGGMINTDASGQGSCQYGKTRDHVLELETVLLDGSTLRSSPLGDDSLSTVKDQQDRAGLVHRIVDSIHKEFSDKIQDCFPPLNRCLTGYDLAHIRTEENLFDINSILCGSEGTLGFITEAKLNLLPIPKYSALVIVKYRSFDASLRDATELMKAGPTSIETIDSKVLQLAMKDFIWHQVETFFVDADGVEGINLVEYTADSEVELKSKLEVLTTKLQSEKDKSNRQGFSLAWGDDAVKRVWAMRKRAVGLLGNAKGEARPVPFVEDTAVPPEHLADFIAEFREVLDAYQLEYGMFGHVDAGVLHVRPALDMKEPAHENIAWEISDRIADLCYRYNGLLWGEHGKGLRSGYAPQFFGELYPQLQRIKFAFDPHNQLNPGKIASPNNDVQLIQIDEAPTRGQRDRLIHKPLWEKFPEAVHCNGNGACYNWNPNDAMCPSWKGTRERIHSPKGRASLIKEWLTQLSHENTVLPDTTPSQNVLRNLTHLPKKVANSVKKRTGEYDFSHEVYESMAGCLACKSCTGQCPIKVDVPEFRSKFLSLYYTRYLRAPKDYLVGSLEFMLPFYAKIPKFYNFVTQLPFVKLFLEKVVGFIDPPKLSGLSLTTSSIPVADEATLQALSSEEKERTVVIVQDAFTSYFETQLILDTLSLLTKLGFNPLLAPYKANGKPLHVYGFLPSFTRTARANALMLRKISDFGVTLVGIDPSMTLTYQSEYRKYLNKDEVPTVHLIQDWLVNNSDKRDNAAIFERGHFKLLPHCTEKTNSASSVKSWCSLFESCNQTLSVLELGCCGMAGTYGHEAQNKASSKKIYQLSWEGPVKKHIDSDQLVASGYSCRCQIKREETKAVRHPIQALLDQLH